MAKIMGVTKARVGFTEIVNQADTHGEPIYLTNFNEPRAVLIGYQAWEALIERLEDLEDAVLFHTRRDEPVRPLEEFLAEMELENTQHGSTLSDRAEAIG
jgi:prevent-host-death family protein